MRKLMAAGIACVLTLSAASIVVAQQTDPAEATSATEALGFGFGHGGHGNDPRAATPIRHVVVIFQENVSFDHYFGTYPFAANAKGEPAFYARPFTPPVNGLTHRLLTDNPNASNTGNADAAINPFRLTRAQAATADQDHGYTSEQRAFHGGRMDLFPLYTGRGETLPDGDAAEEGKGQVMGYYDGNTVTAYWNYAQNFAMSDNHYGTGFGPSTPGAVNLIAGQTAGVIDTLNGTGAETDDGHGGMTMIGDPDPIGDVCSSPTANQVTMGGRNIGDLLNERNITWGWFQGGFDLTRTNADGSTGCTRRHLSSVTHTTSNDYSQHHEPFQYYPSTANPTHARPTSVATIGKTDAANHQYDIEDFYDALDANNLPAVSFLKAPAYQDGHAGYSDPLDEQAFVVHVINTLQQSAEWKDTAVIIAYDDSDGWYDHQAPPHMNASVGSTDALDGDGVCKGHGTLPGLDGRTPAQGRCGFGPRLPLLVVSPWARENMVDHSVTDQSSITRFIEDNWLSGKRIGGGSTDAQAGRLDGMFDFFLPRLFDRKLILDESTGQPKQAGGGGWPHWPFGNGGHG
ncbi:alkaline phosphatase family protein [Dyella sp. 333MFSha]|uniref:phospholipase C n=1 Tax=Dyella sp. 333MFSha TaxID=1798240 RepID=UPI00088C0AC4|nr:alkaline phosphatase family protein [Dyella sp. 333MFSha]SDH01638.1 phospholipase C [Dyella sp. 333MFSha]